jgi:hypothetical protein
MSSVAVHNNLSSFIDAVVAGDNKTIEQTARQVITRAEEASELIGQIGLLAMDGDSDGHTVLTFGAASELTRWLIALRHVLGEDAGGEAAGISLVVQALAAAGPAVRAGQKATHNYPPGLFPSELGVNETVSSALHKAIDSQNVEMVERVLFGLYGTGADYRTLSVRIYEGIAQTFQEEGHALLDAVRGSQVLDAVKWGDDAPHYIHWLTPYLTRHGEEPDWINVVRSFLSEERHSLASYRTRLAAPKNANALPLRALLLSESSPAQVCQAIFDALITNGASAQGVAAVIALAASDLLQNLGDDDRVLFERVAHGLLYASATHLVYTQVQGIEALPLLFTAAAYVNSLFKEFGGQAAGKAGRPANPGGGLIAPSLLEELQERIDAQDVAGALANARRYLQLGYDARALFAVIGLGATRVDAAADQGHALQIVQAAGNAYLNWPADLASTSIEGFLQIALRAAALGKRA